MPRLKHLELSSHYISTKCVLNILSSCPQLEHLDINGCLGVKCDRKKSTQSCRWLDLIRCSRLNSRGLDLAIGWISFYNFNIIGHFVFNFPKMTSIFYVIQLSTYLHFVSNLFSSTWIKSLAFVLWFMFIWDDYGLRVVFLNLIFKFRFFF